MPYPNSALSAVQLAIIAVVAVAALAAWISAVFLAAREPARHNAAAAGTPGNPESALTAVTEPGTAAGPEPAAAAEPGLAPASDRRAA